MAIKKKINKLHVEVEKMPVKKVTGKVTAKKPAAKAIVKKAPVASKVEKVDEEIEDVVIERKIVRKTSVPGRIQTAEGWKRMMKKQRAALKK